MGAGNVVGIGDELIATGQARALQQNDPTPVQVLDRNGTPRWCPIWDGNPRIVRHVRADKPVQKIINGPGVRPYIEGKTSARWTWRDWGGPPRGEIYFTDQEREFGRLHAGRIILEPHIKARASSNKGWGWVRWNKLAWILQNRGFRVSQVGPLGTTMLAGAEHVVTNDFRSAAAVLASARAAVLPEGGLHHAAAAVGLPAVVIFGSFISPAVTGYADQINLFTGEGLGCGMRVPCDCCAKAMAKINPSDVAERLIGILDERVRRLAIS